MNVNTLKRFSLKIPYKNQVLWKQLMHKTNTIHVRYVSMCTCPITTALTNSITSNWQSSFHNVRNNNSKFHDICRRLFSSDNGPPSRQLPPLTNFPQIVWPSLIKSIRNFILATFIIKPYLDREFNIPDFVMGSKQAVEVISAKLSNGDLKSLNGLVTNEIIPNIQISVGLMSLMQREQLAITVDDIYFSFPYQVGIMFNENEGKDHKRYVEITMVYHTLRGLATMRAKGEEPPLNMGMLPEYQARISICNYRFIREFTKGVDSEWTVNLLNHFKPVDQTEE